MPISERSERAAQTSAAPYVPRLRVPFNSFRTRIITIVMMVFIPVILVVFLDSEAEAANAIADAQADARVLAENLTLESRQQIESTRELLLTLTELPSIRAYDSSECSPIFERLLTALPRYTGIFAIRSDTHTVYCSALPNPSLDPLDRQLASYYYDSVETRSFAISNFRIATISRKPVVSMSYPVLDESGRVLGAVAASLSLDWMNSYIEDRVTDLPPESTFTLLDSNGVVLVRYPVDDPLIGTDYPLSLVRETSLEGVTDTLTTTGLDGQVRLYLLFDIPVNNRILHAIVSIPESTIARDAELTRNRTLLAMIGIAAGGVLFAWIISGFVIQPIHSLIGVSRQIASGRVSSRTRLTSDISELRELLSSFNAMADQIEADQHTRIEALANANNQLRDQISERAAAEHRTRILNELAAALSEAVTSEQVANAVIEKGLLPIGSHTAAIAVINTDKTRLHILARYFGDLAPLTTQIPYIPLAPPTPFNLAYLDGRQIWITSHDELEQNYPAFTETNSDESTLSCGAYVPLQVGKTRIGALYIGFPENTFIPEPYRHMIGTIASYCAQALERARLYDVERKAREDIERTLTRIEQLQQTTASLSSAATQEDIGRILVEQGARYLGTQSGAIYLIDNSGQFFNNLYRLNPRTSAEEQARWQQFPVDSRFPMGEAVLSKRPYWFTSVAEAVEMFPSLIGTRPNSEQGGHAIVPILVGDRGVGAISFNFADSRLFDEETRQLVIALSYLCGQALERARLNEQAKIAAAKAAAEQAAQEERARLARDLHDAVSQTLFSATNFAEALPKQWERNPQRAMEILEQLVILNRAAMAEMRSLLFELRPEAVMKTRLSILFMQLINAAKGRRDIKAQLHMEGVFEVDDLTTESAPPREDASGETPVQLPPNVHFTFYRIAQECVTNILKHSSASTFEIELSQQDGIVQLNISDNGQGFEVVESDTGFGLENMRERAEAIDAHFEIDSTPGKGTRVSVSWNSRTQSAMSGFSVDSAGAREQT